MAPGDYITLRNVKRLYLHGNAVRSRIISLQAEDSGDQFLFSPLVPEHPEPDLRTAREIWHTVDGRAQVAVREVESYRRCRPLQPGDINLRQVWTAHEIRLQHSPGHVSARSDPKDILERKDHHEIARPAVLLQEACRGLQSFGKFVRVADAVELHEARRTGGRRAPELLVVVT